MASLPEIRERRGFEATKTVSQGESRYGTPEPQIALRFAS
jgi:hypothetical protein